MLTSNAALSGVVLAALTQDRHLIVVMVIMVLVDLCAKVFAAGQRRHTIFLNTNRLHSADRYTANAPEPVPITAVEDPSVGFRNLDRSRRFLHVN